jgi:hypothetical protein
MNTYLRIGALSIQARHRDPREIYVLETEHIEALDRIRSLEAAGNDLRASLVGMCHINNVMPDSAAERIKRFDDLFASQAETPLCPCGAFEMDGEILHSAMCTAKETLAEAHARLQLEQGIRSGSAKETACEVPSHVQFPLCLCAAFECHGEESAHAHGARCRNNQAKSNEWNAREREQYK